MACPAALKQCRIASTRWSSSSICRVALLQRNFSSSRSSQQFPSIPEKATQDAEKEPRLPRSVQAVYLRPLRREAKYGLPTCDLQLRSYSVRNLEFFADFALRAAYYLHLPAFGPIPLPRITQRWTVPRSNFIFKKSQENYERITLRRLIQIKDGHAENIQLWLAFLRKHAYHGVGMKANIWEFNERGVGKTMDVNIEDLKRVMEPQWSHFGRKKSVETSETVAELMNDAQFHEAAVGIQPTGVPHIGNYLGALQEWVHLQNTSSAGTKLFYAVVDLHAITIPQEPSSLRRWKREALATLLAIGLDPEKSTLFYQSSVPAHSELMWILSCTASTGYLSRMTQWKSKMQLAPDASPLDTSSRAKLKLGLFSYPVLQAADILVHRATHVPVGEDQSQHLEFARECASSFNHNYSLCLRSPETMLSPAKRVMSLQQPRLKMSKSHEDPRSRILLTDEPDVIQHKIMAALTDSTNTVSFDPGSRPGVTNLLQLLSFFDAERRTAEELASVHAILSLRDFKVLVAKTISDSLATIRTRYSEIIERNDGRYLDDIEAEGAVKARASADATMALVKDAIGF